MRDSERARQVAERVAEKIRDVPPERLGSDGWEFTRQHVQHFEDPYLDALNAWGREDSEETRARLRDAAERFVGAWRRAGEEWEAAGRPQVREEVPA